MNRRLFRRWRAMRHSFRRVCGSSPLQVALHLHQVHVAPWP